MLLLSDIRDYLKIKMSSSKWYVGKFNNKEENIICLLDVPTPSLVIPNGGIKHKTYNEKYITLIIQGTSNYKTSEEMAYKVFNNLVDLTNSQFVIKDKKIKKIDFNNSEAVSVGQNVYGIYQFIINFNLIYER